MSKLIVMALQEEGQGKIEALGFEVIYTGIGKVNAAYHATKRLADNSRPVTQVINIGSAGSHTYNSGELVAANRFVQRDMDVTGLGFAMGQTPFETDPAMITTETYFTNLPQGICGSGDSFLQGNCPLNSDIIDMEAYALAKICARERIPFACAKYITDGADHTAHNDWQENLKHAAEAFMRLLKNIM
jgi:adenosylhomocysteine nucleosidase